MFDFFYRRDRNEISHTILQTCTIAIFVVMYGIGVYTIRIGFITSLIPAFIMSALFLYIVDRKLFYALWAKENTYVTIVALIVSIIFSFRAYINLWRVADGSIDCAVFRTVGMMMSKGYMPYRDTFDHKGPLMYLINYAGYCIDEDRGIIVIEILFMAVTVAMIYKTCRIICDRISSTLVTFLSLSLLSSMFQGGNLVEEYAMAFIAVSVYFFLDYLKNDQISNVRLCLCGICFGGVLLLRPNMCSVWLILPFAVLYKMVKERKIKELFRFLSFFILGLAVSILPVLVWLDVNDSLEWCWKAYILFNKEYVTGDGISTSIARLGVVKDFLNYPVILMAFSLQLYAVIKRKHFYDIAYLIYLVVTLVLISISGRSYGHYGMILIPAVAYSLGQFFLFAKEIENDKIYKIIRLAVTVWLLSTFILQDLIAVAIGIPTAYLQRNTEQRSKTALHISQIIQANTTKDQLISVYGYWDAIYIISKRAHATRFSYQYPLCVVEPKIKDEYFRELNEQKPKVIVVQAGSCSNHPFYDESMKAFLNENGYSLEYSEKGESMDGALLFLLEE